ncbi:Polysaccharide biosynthesis/export protein [Pseudovibrio sp. W64]|uniref:polysaccharide biosynthesis/export family protein n=1 Tax=unclassified Pseudovibrio TaxID=2627060 RepID=UPI0007B26AF1|nr:MULTISPECIES: polysaccharide biosynthesis/export family protein [unclassified Pseudovibrio]KZK78737.1 Polysaccharide biosynthesis/export protein [Pseudovibrio sp. W64]KZK85647.1 Polysaccharide biosynthesis/export protein [Pseudovibrio sp. Ad46]
MKQKLLNGLTGLVILGLLQGCASGEFAEHNTQSQMASGRVFSQPELYRLGPSDKLRVMVFGEPDLSGEFVVDDQGKLDLPLIGDIPAGNSSVKELESRIITALKDGYLKEPRVSLEVISSRPFFIQGEVARPGEYSYKNGLTLQDAIAVAGGYSYRANTSNIFIRPVGSNYEVPVNLTGARLYLRPGDSIRIPERYF